MIHNAGVRPSAQRLAVLDYVANEKTHPTADMVYSILADKFPTLSRTTVYNSLHTLAEAGLLRELEIESGNMRYDLADQPPHGHFMCDKCGRVFDTVMPPDMLRALAPGFNARCIDISYKGICPDCMK